MGPFLRSRAPAARAKENIEGGSGSSDESASNQLRPEDVLVGRAASSNQDKFQITKDIVEHVRSNGGRFMVVDGNGLTEVSQKVARQKVGQALRHKRRKLEQEISGGSGRSSLAKASTSKTAPLNSDGTKPSQTSGSQKDVATNSSRDMSQGLRREVSCRETVIHEDIVDDGENIAFAARLNSAITLQGNGGVGRLSQEAADYLSDDFSLLSLAESDKQSTFNTNSASMNGDKTSNKSSEDSQSGDKKPAAKRAQSNDGECDHGERQS